MINELRFASSAPGHRRLAYCLALSTLTVAILLVVFDLRYLWDHAGPVSRPLEVLLPPAKERLEPEPAEDPVTDERTLDEVEERSDLAPRASTDAAETADGPEKVATPPTADSASDEEREIDWQAALERASADTVEAHGTPDSLHPAFDELRRIAAAKYAPPRTGKPPIWENVEDDIYGRKILRHGDCFRVIDDMNVGNQYAFETFEKYLVFCEWRGEGRQEFPWIETIVARYPYLREPDGGLAAIDKD